MSVMDDLARSRYVSLTTYRRDGTAVATPVWVVRNGDELFIVSDAGAGKVKRIRNSGRVVLTACDIRGKIAPGAASAPGTARLLGPADTEAGRALIAGKYLMARIGYLFVRLLRLRRAPTIGIAVTL
jgi:PPOX class probable F420-dependent enzyme